MFRGRKMTGSSPSGKSRASRQQSPPESRVAVAKSGRSRGACAEWRSEASRRGGWPCRMAGGMGEVALLLVVQRGRQRRAAGRRGDRAFHRSRVVTQDRRQAAVHAAQVARATLDHAFPNAIFFRQPPSLSTAAIVLPGNPPLASPTSSVHLRTTQRWE